MDIFHSKANHGNEMLTKITDVADQSRSLHGYLWGCFPCKLNIYSYSLNMPLNLLKNSSSKTDFKWIFFCFF